MDLYTTSFSYPRPTPHPLRSSSPLPTSTLNLPGSATAATVPLPNVTSAPAPRQTSSSTTPLTTRAQVQKDWEAVQKLALEITSREGCLVTVTKEQTNVELGTASPTLTGSAEEKDNAPIPATTVWNFHLSGGYQSVMAARGAVLREIPRDNKTVLKVARTDVLELPLATVSPLKPDVKRRLDEIAADTKAFISVANLETPGGVPGLILATADAKAVQDVPAKVTGGAEAPTQPASSEDGNAPNVDEAANGEETSNSTSPKSPEVQLSGNDATGAPAPGTVTYGLETERMCELIITGSIESVEIAKVRLLVMLDELSGLHAEMCDIDYKLHAIIASRKRCVLQSIQEETATNIYYPTPLVGVLNAPHPGTQPAGYRNLGMGPISVQPTGSTATPMTGNMQGIPGQGPMNGMNLGGQHPMSPAMGMNHHMGGAINNGYGPPPPQPNRSQGPVYNPHQHVHYPYQPQPLDINPQTTRGMPYTGPGVHHYGPGPAPMNNLPHGPMSMNHTGMSQMSQMSHMPQVPTNYGNNRMTSPMPMAMTPGPNMHHAHGPVGHPGQQPHHHQGPMQGLGHHGPTAHPHQGPPGPHHANMGANNGHGHGPAMGMNPYQGQTHMHVGLGAGPMNLQNGMGMGAGMGGQMGMGMGGGVAQYGSGPHPGLSVHSGEQGALGMSNQVWITGEFFGVQRARDMLLNVAVQKSKLVISRDTAILPRKLDWLLTERIEEFKAIMSDNGTYVQVPSVGSQASLITVFGDHRVNIERTIRSIMALACQFYVASFWLLPISFDVLMPSASLNPAQMQPILKRVSHATGAEVVFKSNCFEMHGLEQEVRAAVMMVLELDVIQNFHHEIRFQIELANEHREFISGKKNGKINKIMKLAGVKIKFETFNDYNFLMDISGSDLGAIQGLSMLQEELPAEVSFHVPESYHKRIIGVGGKNIQRIMKLYGVYVKFSNAEEFAALGGYLDNEDNVVARTPAKNAINLESLKQSVMEMVNPKDKDYTVECVSIPRRYHRTLLGEKSIFIHDIEGKTNSIVRFPYKESASDIVTIFGPESQVHIAAAMLLEHVPFEADLHVPPNAELTRLVTTTDFILFTEKVKRDHQIAILPSAKFGQGDEAIFKFRCQRSNIDFLGTARDTLEEFLGQHGVQVYPSPAHKRVDSFTDAFSHFNSKLLSANNAPEAEAEGFVERRQRPTTITTTNVKALFDSGAAPPSNPAFRSMDDSLGFAGPLSYHDPRRVNDLWQSPNQSNGRTESDVSKRDSDPLIQEKVRQAGHQPQSHAARAISARTQSLDITSLNFSRALTGNAFGPVPSSPSAAAVTSSPNTATGQFFPGQHPHALRANATGRPVSTYDTSSVDNITQGLGNVSVTSGSHS